MMIINRKLPKLLKIELIISNLIITINSSVRQCKDNNQLNIIPLIIFSIKEKEIIQ